MPDLNEIAQVLADISNNNSRIYKTDLLRQHAGMPGFKDVLKFIFDPSFVTGIKHKKLSKGIFSIQGEPLQLYDFMQYLKDNPTGTLEDIQVAATFIYSQETDEARWVAEGIATKDLQIGVSLTTLNAVYGADFIPKIGIMRGSLCPETITDTYIVTEKIDGNRRLIFVTPKGIEIYTRSGKRDKGLIEIEEQAKQLPMGYVYDAECVATGAYTDSIALRQASMSILSRDGIRRGVNALIFDMLPIAEYLDGASKFSASTRKAMLAAIFDDSKSLDILVKAQVIPTTTADLLLTSLRSLAVSCCSNLLAVPILGVVDNRSDALVLAEEIWNRQGEGVMLVDVNSVYEVNPNPRKTLLKIKLINEYELLCIGLEEGSNKYGGMLGAIIVEYPHESGIYAVKVGSGFTDHQRQQYWDDPSRVLDKFVEIEAFGESKNASGEYSLSCPVFKRIVGNAND